MAVVDAVGERRALGLGVVVATISGMSSSSRRSPVSGAQITPEVWRTKKAIFSGVAASAAMIRSPSFSRSSSSTTTTISPRPMAATASGIVAKCRRTAIGVSPAGSSGLLGSVRRHRRCRPRSSAAERGLRPERSAYLAITSTSRFTGSPGPLRPEGGDLGGVRDDGDGEAVVEGLRRR